MSFVAGQKLRASELNDALDPVGALPLGVIARNERSTNLLGISSVARVISCRAAMVTGRTYRISARTEVDASVSGATSQAELRYTTNDTEPTTSSATLVRGITTHATSGVPDSVDIDGLYVATTTGFLRAVLCMSRVVGTGTVNIGADSGVRPTQIQIEDVGITVATSGTIY